MDVNNLSELSELFRQAMGTESDAIAFRAKLEIPEGGRFLLGDMENSDTGDTNDDNRF
jgi:hypothetical protein